MIMTFDWSTLVLQTVNFAVLAWLLHRFLYKPVLGLIDARRAEVEKQYAGAAAAEAEAKVKLAAVAAERARISDERADLIKAAAAEAERAAETRRRQGEQAAQALLDDARKKIAQERGLALAEARTAALDLGLDIAKRFMAELPVEQRAEACLARIEQHLAALSPAERAEVRDGAVPGARLHVVTATALPLPVQDEWRARLGQALGNGLDLDFASDPALVAGAELHFPTTILRFSWRSTVATLRQKIDADGHAH